MSVHAPLAPSAAHRWMPCPGSVRLTRGLPDTSSVYADEGTFAHDIGARCLNTGQRAQTAFGTVSTDRRFRVDEAMAAAVQVYLDAVGMTEMLEGRSAVMVEAKVRISADVWGTGDCLLLSADGETLNVFDLKYGAGVYVEVEANEQLLLYALGALLTWAELCKRVKKVVLHVVQPRYYGDCQQWRSWEVARQYVEQFGERVKAAVAATKAADAPLVTGEHCRFCKAKTTCPALKSDALAAAQHAFSQPPTVAPEPKTLEPEEVARLLPLFTRAEEWISAIRAHAYELANQGRAIPGYKLVAKVGNRKWRDEKEAAAQLNACAVDAYDKKLISPAEAERRLGKPRAALVERLAVKPVTGTSLVPDSDRRPAVESGAAVFEPLDDPITQ